jgi:hypothetical protein
MRTSLTYEERRTRGRTHPLPPLPKEPASRADVVLDGDGPLYTIPEAARIIGCDRTGIHKHLHHARVLRLVGLGKQPIYRFSRDGLKVLREAMNHAPSEPQRRTTRRLARRREAQRRWAKSKAARAAETARASTIAPTPSSHE